MPNVVNASEIKAMLFRRHRLLCTLMLQALFRPFQEERSALRVLGEYPHTALRRITREMFGKEGPFYVFERNDRTDAAMRLVEQWLRQAIRRGEAWIEDQQSGRVQLLSGAKDLAAIEQLARSELDRYAQLDAQAPPTSAARQAAVGVKEVLPFPDGKAWVRLVTQTAFRREGKLMDHCIGRNGYYEKSARGLGSYFSLRDVDGMPRVTIEVIDGTLAEARAFSNSDPWDDWHAELFAIMHVMGLSDLSRRPRRQVQARLDLSTLHPIVHEGDLRIDGSSQPRTLPRALKVNGNLVIEGCAWLQALPLVLEVVGDCRIADCSNVRNLPGRLLVRGNASIVGCPGITRPAERIDVRGALDLADCRRLPCLPVSMRVDGDLDISDCLALRPIPAGAVVCGSVRRGNIRTRGVEEMNRYIEAQAGVTFLPPAFGVWSPGVGQRRA